MRLRKIAAEFGDRVRIIHKAYPLRPQPDPTITFDEYRLSRWQVAGAQPDAGEFRPYPADKPYPNWSLPALEAAKCLEQQDRAAFERYDELAFNAIYRDGQNISDSAVVLDLVAQAGGDVEAVRACLEASAMRDAILEDWQEAVMRYRVTGIPTVVVDENPRDTLVGAVPTELYRQAVLRHLAARAT